MAKTINEQSVKGSDKYFCAGRHCAKRDACDRHVASVKERNAEFDDYDIVMLTEGKCKYFIDINVVTQIGPGT